MSPSPEDQVERSDRNARRWRLIRDLVVFVFKVGLEAIRDVLLIPVALAAGVLGLLFSPARPDRFFAHVLRLGDRFDGFVDLFGSAQARRRAGISSDAGDGEPGIDLLFDRAAEALQEQHSQGGVTGQAKETIDRALDSLHRALPRPAEADGRDRVYTALDHAPATPGEDDER